MKENLNVFFFFYNNKWEFYDLKLLMLGNVSDVSLMSLEEVEVELTAQM